LIKAASLRRDLYAKLDNAKQQLMDADNDAAAVLESTRQSLRDMVITGHSWHEMPDVLLNTYEALERRQKGEEKSMPSGIAVLDRITSGFHRGELTIIGARPAVGKSALGMHIALATAAQGYRVGIVSREMTDVQYGARILGSRAEIEPGKMRTGQLDPYDWTQLSEAMQHYSDMNVSFMFSARDIEDLRMEVQRKIDGEGLDMLVIDYLQLLQTRRKFEKDYLRVGYISKAIKDMTTDFNIPIIALAQVGRSSARTVPNLSELRGSGDIEQDADNVIFMHRPEDASDDSILSGDGGMIAALEAENKQYIVLEIAKQRQGQTGRTAVVFDPARMKYTSIAR
jgi:replicative DNA helicase